MANPPITCKLTGAIGPGVKSHIIPRSLYQLNGKPAAIFRVGDDLFERRASPIGEYDDSVVTQEGERLFAAGDEYAAQFFLNHRNHNTGKEGDMILDSQGRPLIARLRKGDFDPQKLRLFCMSVLWRAAATNRPMFSQVSLGSHFSRLTDLIRNQEVGAVEDFSVILGRFDDTPDHGWPIFSPFRRRVDGLRFYRFTLPQLSFDIKVDKQPLHADFLPFAVGGRDDLMIFMKGQFRGTKAHRTLVSAFLANHAAKGG